MIIFIARFILGSVFIYSSFFKLLNPHLFEIALYNYNLFPNSIIHVIVFSFPWIELLLGILLISGILLRFAAITITILLLFFIILTIIGVSRGISENCGCFPKSSFLNNENPLILITRNYFLLALAVIIYANAGLKLQPYLSINGSIPRLALIIALALSLSIFITLIIKHSYEVNLLSIVLTERNQAINELSLFNNDSLLTNKMNQTLNTEMPRKQSALFTVILTLNSFDCSACVDEAIYLEYLNNKYQHNISFCALVGNIGSTAINNFKKYYSITYPFIQSSNILRLPIFSKYKSLKAIISNNNEILRIDPVTYNVKTIRNEYENILKKCLEQKGGVIHLYD